MKVSLNWLREFLDLDKTPQEIADILTSLGLEVEGWETVKPSPVDLHKVVTGLVTVCERIPDTDHLSATQVDVGDGVIRSVVCGAPNVAVGQKVLVALPGAQVFSKDGTLFQIAERKVRGVASQGMICAEDELGLGHDHAGIMVLPPDTPLGLTAAAYFRQDADTVIEVGLTPNRADATNHLGVARDLAAYLQVHEGLQSPLRLPERSALPASGTAYPASVENTEACPRYTGILLDNIRVQESPDWLKNRLLALGQRPINNVVDVTNLVRLEMGQPLHAFDAAEIGGGKIIVQTLPAGTPFVTLDGVERKLLAEDLMICDGNRTPMCIGGVFGGATSGVKDSTTSIFLESAYFHPRWIRRSMLRHGLRTDAAWTFEKGADPNGCLTALERAVFLLQQLAGAQTASALVDIYPQTVEPARIAIRYEKVNALIGEDLSVDQIKAILTALGIGISDETPAGLTAVVPTNKPDVLREADIVEEILRVHGLDNVPLPTHLRSSIEITPKPNPDKLRNFAADFLAAQGFNEAMSLSLSNSAWYTGPNAIYPVLQEELVYVHNTANQGLDCLRPTLVFSGLEAIRNNQNRQQPDLRLFEFGKVYRRVSAAAENASPSGEGSGVYGEVGNFKEVARLAVFLTGVHSAESWQPAAKKVVDFYTLKSVVQNLLARLGVAGFQEETLEEAPFQYALRYHRGGQELVTFGAVQPALVKKMDVKNAVFCADFHMENIIKALSNNKVQYRELSRFPAVRRDLALVLDRNVPFGDIRQLAQKTVKKLLREVNLFDVFEDENKLGAGKKSYAVSFTFEDPDKTLQEKDIDTLMRQLQEAFETKLNANIRR
ncbi:MAG: phenylalanine--tRNA ligase subunit beta [Saprospiraceae bacterium]